MSSTNEDVFQGSDDAFSTFVFALLSSLLVIWALGMLLRAMRDAFYVMRGTAGYVPIWHGAFTSFAGGVRLAITILSDPITAHASATIAIGHPHIRKYVAIPWLRRTVLRPRLVVIGLWLIFLSLAMYTQLSFDAHAVLGVKTDATMHEIKQAGRRLMRKYHPDINKDEEAKPIFANVKKAYKALVDPETFEKDARSEPGTVGIALPTWLVSRDNDGPVVLLCFVFLLLMPLAFWWIVQGGNRLVTMLEEAEQSEAAAAALYRQLGWTTDIVYEHGRAQRSALVDAFRSIGVDIPTSDVEDLPPLPVLRKWVEAGDEEECEKAGFDPAVIPLLRKHWASNPIPAELLENSAPVIPARSEGGIPVVQRRALLRVVEATFAAIDLRLAAAGQVVASQVHAEGMELKAVRQARDAHSALLKVLREESDAAGSTAGNKSSAESQAMVMGAARAGFATVDRLSKLAEEARMKAGHVVGQRDGSTSDVQVQWVDRKDHIIVLVGAPKAVDVKCTVAGTVLMIAGEARTPTGGLKNFTTELRLAGGINHEKFVSQAFEQCVLIGVGKEKMGSWRNLTVDNSQELPWLSVNTGFSGSVDFEAVKRAQESERQKADETKKTK